ncbi:MAG: iron-containing alcohol dehydrogenase [Ilumatobacter sp.]|nr:MAG: iron-containing alcohol dehydrogenase [Ilumatobacter sp.]
MTTPHRARRTLYGPGAIFRLTEIVRELDARRVLLVTGGRSFESSGAADALPALEQVAEVTRWCDFAPNTDADDLAIGRDVLETADPELVVGIGGGSVMDMAKLLVAFDHVSPSGLHEAIRAGAVVPARRRGLVLAPTTSGSGSEATHFAVVYIGDSKYSIAGETLRADRVLLDPDLARSGSRHQRATSGVDALCQATESLWAVNSTPVSRRYARHGLELVMSALIPFTDEPTARAARAMSIGSHLAGRAIDISKTTAAHALSYGITKRYGTDHGNAVAVTLGPFIDEHLHAMPGDLQPGVDPTVHRDAMETIRRVLRIDGSRTGTESIRAVLRRIGLAATLTEVGADSDHAIASLAAAVNVERLGNNPVRFDPDGLVRVLVAATR